MQLPAVDSVKRPLFAVAFFTLLIYMVNRAISAIVYPFDSEILSQGVQQEAGDLFFLDLDFSTHYVANSIVFPLLLVVFYRLAAMSLKKPLIMALALHYVSVVSVCAVAAYAAYEEFHEQTAQLTQYEDATGHIVTERYSQQGGGGDFGPYVQIEEDDQNRLYYLGDEGEPVFVTRRNTIALPLLAMVGFFYSPIAAFLLVLIGLAALPFLYRYDYGAILPNAEAEAGAKPED
ncbi:hypothetical protein [Kordiimonas sp.]|uniref:hypothetical protein n=1 Tax=Kordiimonas sp. TaxID=1970157 RepID=UPI003A8D3C7E